LWKVHPSYVNVEPVVITLFGATTWVARSAAATTSLYVDPGGIAVWVACSRKGSPGASSSASRAAALTGGPKRLSL